MNNKLVSIYCIASWKWPLVLALICMAVLPELQAQPGSLDPTFNANDLGYDAGIGVEALNNGFVGIQSVVEQPDGKLLVGGSFNFYNKVQVNGIVRLNADGTRDDAFFFSNSSNLDMNVTGIALQPDGKVVLVGSRLGPTAGSSRVVMRLNTDGSLDNTFQVPIALGGFDLFGRAVAIQPDGKILVAGVEFDFEGNRQGLLTRLNPDGSIDPTFENLSFGDANGSIEEVIVTPGGSILVAGGFTRYFGQRNHIARLNADGSVDNSFQSQTGANRIIYSMALQPDGKILIGGAFTSYNGQVVNRFARLNADGTLDASFNAVDVFDRPSAASSRANTTADNALSDIDVTPGFDRGVFDIQLYADGKVQVCGEFGNYNGEAVERVARLNADGSLDSGFSPPASAPGASNFFNTICLRPGGKVLTGTQAATAGFDGGIVLRGLVQFNADGSIDLGFNPQTGADGEIYDAVRQPDGKIIIVGDFLRYNGSPSKGIARLNADGTIDATFNSEHDFNNAQGIRRVALQPADGKIIIAGAFNSYGGATRRGVARLNSDGSLDETFDPGGGVLGFVLDMMLAADGKIYLGGNLSNFNGNFNISHLIRLNADGSLDDTFSPSLNVNVQCIEEQMDGKILIGVSSGPFIGVNERRGIMRLNPDGSFDPAFDPGERLGGISEVTAIELAADGKIYVGGRFSSFIDGVFIENLARLNADGSLDSTWVNGGPGGPVLDIVEQLNGQLLIGGNFTDYRGTTRRNIARANTDGSLDGSFNTSIGAFGLVWKILPVAEEEAIITGRFSAYSGVGRNRIARISTEEPTCDIAIAQVGTTSPSCPGELGAITVTAACGSCADGNADIEYSIDNINFSSSNVISSLQPGTYTVYIRDADDNSCSASVANISIEAAMDVISPIVVCTDPVITLSGDGTYALQAEDVVDQASSTDNCGIVSYSVSSGKTSFDCNDVGSSFSISVMAVDGAGNTGTCQSIVTIAASNSLPTGWNPVSTGNAPAVTASFDPCTDDDGSFSLVTGGLNPINGTADNLGAALQALCGDFTITARVTDVSNGYAGLIVRETQDAGSKYIGMYTAGFAIYRRESRTQTNGMKQAANVLGSPTGWMRIERLGNLFRLYRSSNGQNFTLMTQLLLPMQNCVQVGIAAFSTNPSPNVLGSATISDVAIVNNSPAPLIAATADAQARFLRAGEVIDAPGIWIEDLSGQQVSIAQPSVYPNPANGLLTVQWAQPLLRSQQLTVQSTLGQVMQRIYVEAGTVTLPVSLQGLSAGTYFLRSSEWVLPVVVR